MRIKAISQFLQLIILSITTLWLAVVATWIYYETTHEVKELFDAEMAQMARTIQNLVTANQAQTDAFTSSKPALALDHSVRNQAIPGHPYEKKLAFQVWDGDQKPILSNHTKENDTLQLNTEYGYHDVNQGPLRWRTFTLFSPQDDRFIQVAQRHDIRSELVHEIVLSTTLPFMIVLPLLLITLGIAIKRSFRPLNRLSNEIRSYVPQHLNPIDPARVPLEALSLVEALNTLMHRVSSTLARERAFTANAAHELRTPLTAIRLHAQNLHNQIVSQQGISLETTNSIVASVDRMTHVVHQLLTLAQTSSNLPPSQHPIAISTLIERVVRHLTPLAEEKNQTVRVHAPDVPPIYLHEMMLETLLMNLLDNAIRYTPTQGHIKVSATWQQERLTLIVEDNGPGIPDAEKQKVTQRFYRVRGTTAPGSGLGLAIVGDIIEELHGTLNFENAQANGCGLQVVLTIPASATPPTPGRPAF